MSLFQESLKRLKAGLGFQEGLEGKRVDSGSARIFRSNQKNIKVGESREDKIKRLNNLLDFYYKDYRRMMKELQDAGVEETNETKKELNIWKGVLKSWGNGGQTSFEGEEGKSQYKQLRENFADFEEPILRMTINQDAIEKAFKELKEKKVPAAIREALRQKEAARKRQSIIEVKNLDELLLVLDKVGGLESSGNGNIVFIPKSLREKVEDTVQDVFKHDLKSLPPQGFQKGSPYLYKLRDVSEVYGLEETVARLLTEELESRKKEELRQIIAKEEKKKNEEIKQLSPELKVQIGEENDDKKETLLESNALVSGAETESILANQEIIDSSPVQKGEIFEEHATEKISLKSDLPFDTREIEKVETEKIDEKMYHEYLAAAKDIFQETKKRYEEKFTSGEIMEIAKRVLVAELVKRKETLKKAILGGSDDEIRLEKLIQDIVQNSVSA